MEPEPSLDYAPHLQLVERSRECRSYTAKSSSASKSLAYIINTAKNVGDSLGVTILDILKVSVLGWVRGFCSSLKVNVDVQFGCGIPGSPHESLKDRIDFGFSFIGRFSCSRDVFLIPTVVLVILRACKLYF